MTDTAVAGVPEQREVLASAESAPYRLQRGDVIVLENRTKEDIAVKVGGRTKFLASPGRVGKRLALRLTDEVKEN